VSPSEGLREDEYQRDDSRKINSSNEDDGRDENEHARSWMEIGGLSKATKQMTLAE